MTNAEFKQRVIEAERNVRRMDQIDGRPDRELRTVLFALEAGLKNPETGAGFDAYVMLRDVVDKQAAARAT